MKPTKIKHYRIPVSLTFPATHPRKGEPTFFPEMILSALGKTELLTSICFRQPPLKLHTCRGKYEKWAKIMAEVHEGKAVLDLYYWNGVPYRKGVKQVVFATLDKDSGCGVQKLYFSHSIEFPRVITEDDSRLALMPKTLAKNDGLSLEDFKAWFKGADLSEPLAIIHFTSFSY